MRMITKDKLKDRLRAFAVFTGIAIGAVSGFELIITGGFDPLTPRAMSGGYAEQARDESARYTQARFEYEETSRGYMPTSYAPPAYNVEATSMTIAEQDLAGAPGDEPDMSVEALIPTPSSAELYAEIDRLYREDAPAPSRFASAEEEAADWDEPVAASEPEDAYAEADEAYPEDIWSADLR